MTTFTNSVSSRQEPCLPSHLAAIFMDTAKQGQRPALDLISLLTIMGLGTDIDLAKKATASLYGEIIHPLCDDFSSHSLDVANMVLITMIQSFCRTPKGKETAQILQDFHLTDQTSFLCRYRKLITPQALPHEKRRPVKKVFILSRVTLGADIAITSLIISRVQKAMPHAQIFLVGPEHLRLLFYNNGLRYLEFSYQRYGTFLEKMGAWPRLFQLIGEESKDLTPQEILLFDTDSRLSQLGLLPLTQTTSTHYLCSRQDIKGDLSLSDITTNWLDHIFTDTPPSFPYFSINPEKLAPCQLFASHLRPTTFKIVVNFGVGNDATKRLADPFEEELLATLLKTKDTLIILDSGKGEHEETMAKRLLAKMAETGYKTAEISESQLAHAEILFQHGLLRFTGKIDTMAGLISSNDLFIGYDSCGQHVATATETPAIICFAGAPNKRFLERWQPGNQHGKTTTIVIAQNHLSTEQRSELIGKIVKTAGRYRP